MDLDHQNSEIPFLGEVVIVDDDEELLNTLEEFLQLRHCSVRKAVDADGCLKHFQSYPPDMAIIDLGLQDPEKDGIWLLEELSKISPDVPVVVLSGFARLEAGVRAMRVGATDFIEKPILPQYLFEVVKRSIILGRERRRNLRLKQSLYSSPSKFVGQSSVSNSLLELIVEYSKKNSRILLTGPIGSGKHHAARYMHDISSRKSEPFIVVNCFGKSPDEIERELFGETLEDGHYVPGKLEQADGGTIYFNEFTYLPLNVQSRLTNALVQRRFQRVGGSSSSPIDFRVISGSSKNLDKLLKDGLLQSDLLGRLGVEKIEVPPLEARRDDIPDLCRYFMDFFCEKDGLNHRKFSEESMICLQSIKWPGNIRQLRNLVERLLLERRGNEIVSIEDIQQSHTGNYKELGGLEIDHLWGKNLRQARGEFERIYLVTQINRFGGSVSNAAEHIGMERTALHRKLKDLGVITKRQHGGRIAGVIED